MNADNFSWDYDPVENPDWGYARNLFTAIKRPQATWSQSVFSARHENLLAPNRDFRHQGLCCFSGKDYWKFLDAVFFEIKGVRLEPKKVTARPWGHTYRYEGEGTSVDVSYFLSRDDKEGIAGKVIFDVSIPFISEIVIKPLVDIRKANGEAQNIGVSTGPGRIVASSSGNEISFIVKGSSVIARKEAGSWMYKLGSGFRENSNGVRFIPEYSRPVFVGEIHKTVKGRGKVILLIGCNRKPLDFDEKKEEARVEGIARKFEVKKDVMARLLSLDSFGVFDDGKIIPEAGDFWFRQIWLRDLLESTLANFKTYSKINEKKVKEIMDWCLKNQDPRTGRFYNFKGNTDSIDASLLFFMLAEKANVKTMEKRIGESYDLLMKRLLFDQGKEQPAIVNGLVRCLPWHSWTDSRVLVNGKMVPARIPREWLPIYSGQRVLLPEVNAMFIRMLNYGKSIGKETDYLYEKAKEAYRKTFINNDFICSAVMDGMKDTTESSMALSSAVILYGHVFNKNDLEKMWPFIEKLIVRRDGRAFGVLCRNVSDRTYYNDCQYHGAVVWPRDMPYLISYLKLIGKNGMANEILESNLEHQMNEGAIFYSNELFSLPEGTNPSPTQDRDKLVPVKNPIQLWSNFCDDYICD